MDVTHEEAIQRLKEINEVCETVIEFENEGHMFMGPETARVILKRNTEIIQMLEAEEDDGK